jgi:hypothetical protein
MLGLVSAFAAVSTTGSASPIPFPDLVPAVLKISYSHDMWGVAEVELQDRKVIYKFSSITEGKKSGFVKPTIEEWSKFIAELNAAKVYKWDDHYKGLRMADDGGFYWSVELQLGERRFISDGNTAFPTDGDLKSANDPKNYVSYEKFNQAVSRLIGHDFP